MMTSGSKTTFQKKKKRIGVAFKEETGKL